MKTGTAGAPGAHPQYYCWSAGQDVKYLMNKRLPILVQPGVNQSKMY